jgi:hypothetical protein
MSSLLGQALLLLMLLTSSPMHPRIAKLAETQAEKNSDMQVRSRNRGTVRDGAVFIPV